MPRPNLKPTEEQRALVKTFAAVGTSHTDIARKIGIRSPKTLRKPFHEELDSGVMDANYKVARKAFEIATSGEHPAMTIFWLKTRNGFREMRTDVRQPVAPPPLVITQDQEGPAHDQA